MKELILPTNFCSDFKDTDLWLSRSSLREVNLTFLSSGIKNRRLCGYKGGLLETNEVAEIDEDVTCDIKGCLSTLEVRSRAWRGIAADLKLPEVAVVNVLGTGYPMRTNITSSNQAYGMIQVRASLPARGEGIKNKVPAPPLKPKVGSTFCRKKNMVIATFVVASGLKITLVDVSGKVSNKIQRKREISDPQIEESLVVAHARL